MDAGCHTIIYCMRVGCGCFLSTSLNIVFEFISVRTEVSWRK